MSPGEETLLIALAAFAAGVALGKLWSGLTGRRRPRERKRLGETIHYILGLDYLAARQTDRAVEELTRAARADTEAIEIYLVLGNLFRDKGQLERAIQIHQSILHRPGLDARERAHALLCLGVDFKRAGFRNRALDTLNQVLELDPGNAYALFHLMKIYEEEQDWEKALAIEQRIPGLGDSGGTLAAFLHDRIGQAALAEQDEKKALRSFEAAIGHDPHAAPPQLHLGDLLARQGRIQEAVASWELWAREHPESAHLLFERLESAYRQVGEPQKIEFLYRDVIDRDAKDWRAHLALARRKICDRDRDGAFELLLEALENNPHALAVHMEAWRLLVEDGEGGENNGRARRLLDRLRGSVLFLDPHVCVKCHYRADGVLWRCPHCQEWNSFVEERLESRRAGPAV